jgi:hypothetical protein
MCPQFLADLAALTKQGAQRPVVLTPCAVAQEHKPPLQGLDVVLAVTHAYPVAVVAAQEMLQED